MSEGRSLTIELLLTGGDRNRTQMVEMTAHVSPRAAQGTCTCTRDGGIMEIDRMAIITTVITIIPIIPYIIFSPPQNFQPQI